MIRHRIDLLRILSLRHERARNGRIFGCCRCRRRKLGLHRRSRWLRRRRRTPRLDDGFESLIGIANRVSVVRLPTFVRDRHASGRTASRMLNRRRWGRSVISRTTDGRRRSRPFERPVLSRRAIFARRSWCARTSSATRATTAVLLGSRGRMRLHFRERSGRMRLRTIVHQVGRQRRGSMCRRWRRAREGRLRRPMIDTRVSRRLPSVDRSRLAPVLLRRRPRRRGVRVNRIRLRRCRRVRPRGVSSRHRAGGRCVLGRSCRPERLRRPE
jgi:hypothetical protein